MSEVKFWSDFYEAKFETVPNAPSNFALFVSDWIKTFEPNFEYKKFVEVGCGTGRDSKYFASCGYKIVGIDQAKCVIEKNQLNNSSERETYIVADFTNLDPHCKLCSDAKIVYSRFTIHSVSKIKATLFYNWVKQSMDISGILCIEARSIKDPLFKKGLPDPEGDQNATIFGHYRRFIDIDELEHELTNFGFIVRFKDEKSGLSICGDDDPIIVRMIVQKQTIPPL